MITLVSLLAALDRDLGRLGREELRGDVGEDTSLGDDDVSKEAVQLLVVADRELEVAGNDARLLVVTAAEDGRSAPAVASIVSSGD